MMTFAIDGAKKLLYSLVPLHWQKDKTEAKKARPLVYVAQLRLDMRKE